MPTTQTHATLTRRALGALTAFTLCASTLQIAAPPASAQAAAREFRQHQGDPIEGSWICKIDRVDQGVSFTALQSFTAGGVVVATGSLDKVNPVSPVYGSWKRIGPNRIGVTIYFFLFDPTGNPVGTLKTDEIFLFGEKNQLSGAGSSYVCDVQGENCNHGAEKVAITGKRILPLGLDR